MGTWGRVKGKGALGIQGGKGEGCKGGKGAQTCAGNKGKVGLKG